MITEDFYLQHGVQSATPPHATCRSSFCQELLVRLLGRYSHRGHFQRDLLARRELPASLLQPRAMQACDHVQGPGSGPRGSKRHPWSCPCLYSVPLGWASKKILSKLAPPSLIINDGVAAIWCLSKETGNRRDELLQPQDSVKSWIMFGWQNKKKVK